MFKGELEGDLEGDLKWYLKADLKGDFEVDLEVDLEWTSEGTSNRTSGLGRGLAVKLRSVKVQVRSGPGLVQVWFSIELKFNSFELDSVVGRLVFHQILTSFIQ